MDSSTLAASVDKLVFLTGLPLTIALLPQMARLRQFKYFTRLPPEIQHMIWEYSPPPLVHILYGYSSSSASAFPGVSSIVNGVGYAIYSPRAGRFLTKSEHDTFGIAKERFEQLPVTFALCHNTTPVPISTSGPAASASASLF
ncbi:hypothetical protein F4778DRAFT_777569 [Xylariomycetidae sp. FL2044]|nr:hypothetical protein F4778DRAFT_777569 [Xylariomycetidae sp. FL2044]